MFGKLLANWASPSELRKAGVLGLNRRNYNVIAKYNPRRLYPLVDDKVQTKTLANKAVSYTHLTLPTILRV